MSAAAASERDCWVRAMDISRRVRQLLCAAGVCERSGSLDDKKVAMNCAEAMPLLKVPINRETRFWQCAI
jgi:hypothetical protein